MNRYRAKAQPWLLLAALLTAGGAVLAAPQTVAEGFRSGVSLCLGSVLPALFPFFVLCGMLISDPAAWVLGLPLRPLSRAFGLDGTDAPLALALSWLGGYAVCARTVADLRRHGRLDPRQAELLLLLGFCSGPGFVVGCLGGLLLGSVRTGAVLYGLQLAANLLSAACLLPFLPPQDIAAASHAAAPAAKAPPDGLPGAISRAVDSSLQVCGCTVFFCILDRLLRPHLPALPLAGPFVSALLEVSTGAAAFAAQGGGIALYGLCFCLSLPGLSVFCQAQTLLGGAVPMRRLLAARFVHIVWLQGLMHLCTHFMPGAVATWSSLGGRVIAMNRLPPDSAFICFIFLCCTLYKWRQTFYNRHCSPR